MTEITNEFSWSKSRDETFQTCPRKYYFQCYGYWNGWLPGAPERTRHIYVLRNLMNRFMWAGRKVHDCIARSIKNISRGISLLPIDQIIEITIKEMRNEFINSRNKFYYHRPKSCGLFEHEYDLDISDEEWKENAENVKTCLKTFYDSPLFESLGNISREDWIEIEELSYFHLDGTRIWVVLDCCHWSDDEIHILDWKTGKGSTERNTIQLACYGFYAHHKWNIETGKLKVLEFNLTRNHIQPFRISSREIENIRDYIRGSVSDMQSILIDMENNVPKDEGAFVKVDNQEICKRCNFQKVCKEDQHGAYSPA